MSEYSNVGTTLYLGRRRRSLNTTYIQRWSNVMCLLGKKAIHIELDCSENESKYFPHNKSRANWCLFYFSLNPKKLFRWV